MTPAPAMAGRKACGGNFCVAVDIRTAGKPAYGYGLAGRPFGSLKKVSPTPPSKTFSCPCAIAPGPKVFEPVRRLIHFPCPRPAPARTGEAQALEVNFHPAAAPKLSGGRVADATKSF